MNLRGGPATSYDVVAVMPEGSAVELLGELSGSYAKITWDDLTGWVAAEFLGTEVGVTESTPEPETPVATEPTVTPEPETPAATEPTVTPDATATESTVAPEATSEDARVSALAIGTTPIGTATVTTVGLSLNMRSGPGTSFGVVRSIPSGAQVELMGEAENGFRPVRYQGTQAGPPPITCALVRLQRQLPLRSRRRQQRPRHPVIR